MTNSPDQDLALLLKALSFAAHKHRDQRRKDAEASPYINHPIALAQVLVAEGGVTDIEVLAAALLPTQSGHGHTARNWSANRAASRRW